MNFYDNIEDLKYKNIINDIINNDKFRELDNIEHHGGTRLKHSLKVSYYSYKISKFMKVDYIAVARAGLLHDFYFEKTKQMEKTMQKVKLFSVGHPKEAVNNASELFALSDKEKDIIKSHMFPIDYKIPKYIESWIVSLVDKVISFKEFGLKANYKLTTTINLWLILLINIKK